MTYLDIIRSFADNPQNPKNVQMPVEIFLSIDLLLSEVTTPTLSDEGADLYTNVRRWINDKKNSTRNRQAYRGIVRAQTNEEKQAAYENYHNTKALYNA